MKHYRRPHYPLYYTMNIEVFEHYKQVWIKRTINLGICDSVLDATDKAYINLAEIGRKGWRNLSIVDERGYQVYHVDRPL